MASRLQQFQTKAAQISELVTKNGSCYYKELMEKNKSYIKEPSNIETCQLLAKQLFYTRLASIPRRHEAFWKELHCLKEFLKTREAWNIENASMAALIGVECYTWFFGEKSLEEASPLQATMSDPFPLLIFFFQHASTINL
ncbi:Mitochondrial ATP synthase subunit G protein isoform 2 [Hibiscus syriacus]|uniref:Mitochondrial ATP synthase subunit G protein isoform 2 n=1 Tax=Hibiscus syriacus TaxID=106335 RepID=A0A6A3BG82_HIBSY|nr:Mitochondrial ATP synthase subunit G protein isoform 2 [Hibiscus syriacus]